MFAKCFFQNIKHHPLRYITIVVCEIVMIILSMIANGIFLDSLAEYNGAKLWSRYFKFASRGNPKTVRMLSLQNLLSQN